jgi:hypothetical protein
MQVKMKRAGGIVSCATKKFRCAMQVCSQSRLRHSCCATRKFGCAMQEQEPAERRHRVCQQKNGFATREYGRMMQESHWVKPALQDQRIRDHDASAGYRFENVFCGSLKI